MNFSRSLKTYGGSDKYRMKTFKQFVEEKKKLALTFDVGGEPQVVEKSKKKKKKGIVRKLNLGGEPIIVNSESIQPWILDGKYQQAMEKLKGSKFFNHSNLPKEFNLSAGQLQTIFGNEVKSLMDMGIIVRKQQDLNWGHQTSDYTLVNPTLRQNESVDNIANMIEKNAIEEGEYQLTPFDERTANRVIQNYLTGNGRSVANIQMVHPAIYKFQAVSNNNPNDMKIYYLTKLSWTNKGQPKSDFSVYDSNGKALA